MIAGEYLITSSYESYNVSNTIIIKEIQSIVKQDVKPIVHKEVIQIIQTKMQPIIQKTIQPIIRKEIQKKLTSTKNYQKGDSAWCTQRNSASR